MIPQLKLDLGRFRPRSDETEEPDSTLHGYRLEQITEREASSLTVYQASLASTGERVRVSAFLLPEEPRLRRRIRRGAKKRVAIRHPNVLPAREAFEDGAHLYLATDWTDLPTLAARLDDGPLEPRGAATVLSQVAEGVEALHAAGIANALLSPGGIVLDDGGRVMLTDSGTATSLTELVQPWAHPHARYFSPELGEGEHLGPRTSVYSLGCILFEALAGSPPYAGNWITLSDQHAAEAIPTLNGRRRGLGAAIDAVIARALADDPNDRFSSPVELMKAAAAALEEVSEAAGEQRGAAQAADSTPGAPTAAQRQAQAAAELEAEIERQAEAAAVRNAERQEKAEAEAERQAAAAVLEAEAERQAEAAKAQERPETADAAQREAEVRQREKAEAAQREAEARAQAEEALEQARQRAAVAAQEREAQAARRRAARRKAQLDERRTAERRARAEERRQASATKRRARTEERRRAAITQPERRRKPAVAAPARRPKLEAGPIAPRPVSPPAGGTDRARLRRGLPILVGCALLGIFALGGYLAGAAGESSKSADLAAAGPLSIELPDSWERRRPAKVVPGVRPATAVAAGPRDSKGAGLVAWRVAGDTPPLAGSSRPGGAPADPVRLGRFEAYRRRSRTSTTEIVTYAVPTASGAAVVACHADRGAAADFMSGCERVASTLKLEKMRALPLGALAAERRRFGEVLRRLGERRSAGRLVLSGAQTPSEQAYRAQRLQAAFRDARRSLERMAGRPGSSERKGVVRALGRGERAYGTLAEAAARRSVLEFDSARREVDRAEAALASAITRLGD